MENFNSEYFGSRIEAMKITQNTLQQLMAMSAGGLVLYFSFIGAEKFITSIATIGLVVVWCWVISLCAAAVGHKVIGDMIMSLNSLSTSVANAYSLESMPEKVEEEASNSVNPQAIVERAKIQLAKERKVLHSSFREFNDTFFLRQKITKTLISVSLSTLLIGFISIGVAYSLWVVNLP